MNIPKKCDPAEEPWAEWDYYTAIAFGAGMVPLEQFTVAGPDLIAIRTS